MEKLFNLLPPQDVLDPEAFLAAAIVLFAQYPVQVCTKAISVIARKSDRPTLRLMTAMLDKINERYEREAERQSAHASYIAGLLPRPQRTPEQQARIDAQVSAARRALGIPERNRGTGPPTSSTDDKKAVNQ